MQDSAGKRDNPRRPIIELPPPKRTATARPTNHAPSSPPDNASKNSGANNGGLPTPDHREVPPSTPANKATETRREAEPGGASAAGNSSGWPNWQIAIAVVLLCGSLSLLVRLFITQSSPRVTETDGQANAKLSKEPPHVVPMMNPDSRATVAQTESETKTGTANSTAIGSVDPQNKKATEKYEHGQGQFQKGNYEEAERDYRAAISLDPMFAEAWAGLGWALYWRTHLTEAILAFRKAVELNPALVNGWKGLAEIYIVIADARGAADALAQLRRLDRDAAVKMEKQITTAFSKKLASISSSSNAANVASVNEQKKKAVETYQQARIRYQKGNYEEAERDYRAAVSLDLKYAEAWSGLGWALSKRSNSSEAILAFRKAVELKPALVNAWKGLAELYVAAADAPAASDAIKHLQQIDRDAAAEVQREVTTEFSQQLAIAEFPALGVLDSPFNREFRNRYDHYAFKEPDYLKRRDWPVRLARETAAALKEKTRTPKR